MKNHEHAGFSWYISNRPGVYNPYNKSDQISRITWYDNIINPHAKESNPKNIRIKKHEHYGSNALFTSLACQRCSNVISYVL